MTSTQHLLERAPTTAALVDALKAAFGVIPVGTGVLPKVETPAGSGTFVTAKPPYVIVFPLWTNLDGPAYGDDRHADAEWTYQISLYSERGDQLEAMRDRAFHVILGKTDGAYTVDLDTEGVKIMERGLKEDNGIGEPVGSILPSDFRVALSATPADT